MRSQTAVLRVGAIVKIEPRNPHTILAVGAREECKESNEKTFNFAFFAVKN